MPSTAYDLRYVQAGVEQIENYLLSNDIYRPVGVNAPFGETPYPQLTLGVLLLASQRLRATAILPSQQAEATRLEMALQASRSHWRSAWGKKAAAEFHARLNLWSDFLQDYHKEPAAHYDRYPYEVGRRVVLELLLPETIDLPEAERQLLAALDQALHAIFHPGSFVWEPGLRASFPQETYWYLYGEIPKE